MLVEQPIVFLAQKFANMLDYLQEKYPHWAPEAERLRSVPPAALYSTLRAHLLPHAQLVEAGRLVEIASQLDPQLVPVAEACAHDEKAQRYLRLFVELVR